MHPDCRVSSDIEVQNLAASVLDYEKCSSWNVNVGTVKKSKVTITAR